MKILFNLTENRLKTIINIANNPILFFLYQQGGYINTFSSFNQPWFHQLNVATILDIGANIGRFAITMNALLPNAKIYSFEPIPDCFEQLQIKMSKVANFKGFNIALGEESGTLPFERNDFSPSSSFLKMKNSHMNAFPKTSNQKTIDVKIERLDDFAHQLDIQESLMIKIDVQGYEKKVIEGAEKTIKRAKLILTETSFEKLYEDQALFDDIYRILSNWGFTYAGSLGQLHNPQTGQVIQEDSIFIKNS